MSNQTVFTLTHLETTCKLCYGKHHACSFPKSPDHHGSSGTRGVLWLASQTQEWEEKGDTLSRGRHPKLLLQ
ncbi:Hypothetical predicted protein [Scomber scombrus]|uniref:Uncharacterized protein n=1 Tax=Scomber scombrus TaxID=13677 RepID=A0AAV1NJX2_SCOSC